MHEIAHITQHLLDDLVAFGPPNDREVEAAKARELRSIDTSETDALSTACAPALPLSLPQLVSLLGRHCHEEP